MQKVHEYMCIASVHVLCLADNQHHTDASLGASAHYSSICVHLRSTYICTVDSVAFSLLLLSMTLAIFRWQTNCKGLDISAALPGAVCGRTLCGFLSGGRGSPLCDHAPFSRCTRWTFRMATQSEMRFARSCNAPIGRRLCPMSSPRRCGVGGGVVWEECGVLCSEISITVEIS